jgi:hypothetical protein
MPRPQPGGRDFKAFLLAQPWWDHLEVERDRARARQVDLADGSGTDGMAGFTLPAEAKDGTAGRSAVERRLNGG